MFPKDLLVLAKKAPVGPANPVKNDSGNSVSGMKRVRRFGSVQITAFEQVRFIVW
jgi:hypothetical protein